MPQSTTFNELGSLPPLTACARLPLHAGTPSAVVSLARRATARIGRRLHDRPQGTTTERQPAGLRPPRH